MSSRLPMIRSCACVPCVLGIVLGLISAIVQGAGPAGKDAEAAEDAERTQAIQRGTQYLKERQRDDGTWTHQAFPQAITPLCLYALLRSGADPQEALLQKAAAETKQLPIQQLYAVAVQVMALAAADPKVYAEAIQERVDWLEKAQALQGNGAGGWSYTVTVDRADGSCTRFALLALHRAAAVGAKVQPHTWQLAESYWVRGQSVDGGWGYLSNTPPTLTMTLAGIASLAITRHNTGPAVADQSADALAKGQAWLKNRLNPQGQNWLQGGFRQYLFHCGERAATLRGDSLLGQSDWRKDWLPALLKDQDDKSGGWIKEPNLELVNTSLALICLSPEPE